MFLIMRTLGWTIWSTRFLRLKRRKRVSLMGSFRRLLLIRMIRIVFMLWPKENPLVNRILIRIQWSLTIWAKLVKLRNGKRISIWRLRNMLFLKSIPLRRIRKRKLCLKKRLKKQALFRTFLDSNKNSCLKLINKEMCLLMSRLWSILRISSKRLRSLE